VIFNVTAGVRDCQLSSYILDIPLPTYEHVIHNTHVQISVTFAVSVPRRVSEFTGIHPVTYARLAFQLSAMYFLFQSAPCFSQRLPAALL
jgi:hypothetical protein